VAAPALTARKITGAIQPSSVPDASVHHTARCLVSATRTMAPACARKESLAIIVIDVTVVPPVISRTVHRVVNALTTGLKYWKL